MGGIWNRTEPLFRRLGNGGVGERDAQHVSTHMPGGPTGAANWHRHYYITGPLNIARLTAAVTRLEDTGLIGQPRLQDPGRRALRASQLDPTMDTSLDVGARVRQRFNLPARQGGLMPINDVIALFNQ